MREKAKIMDSQAVARAITRISHEIIERNKDLSQLIIVGIQRRGVPLAKLIAQNIEKNEGIAVPVGILDITLYRDDLSELSQHPILNATEMPFVVRGKTIVMVDDVMFTGRTARAAMDAIIDLGRPQSLQLAVLIDRGHRELPLRADYVGKNVPTSTNELVSVCIQPIDTTNEVVIYEKL